MKISADFNQKIYRHRLEEDVVFRNRLYAVLCENFFQKYIPEDSSILEVGAGYCEFINNIRADTKIVLDINPDANHYAQDNVRVIIGNSTNMKGIEDESIDKVFINNFLEHITKPDIILTLKEVHRILKPSGEILIVQPNIRYCQKDYWMFFDHITPLDDRSLTEVLELSGFTIIECIPKLLPFTTKSKIPKSITGLKLYIKFPFFWRFLGKQAFLRAAKKPYGQRDK